MIGLEDRRSMAQDIEQAHKEGARLAAACELAGISARTLQRWKAQQGLMLYYRDTPREILDELWRRFRLSLEPLAVNDKLTAVHFQFAPWVINDRDGIAHVMECVDRMQGQQLTVEFRNQVWFDDAHRARTLEFQREMGVAHTIVDAPQVGHNSVPAVWEITNTSLALVRLHGRNHATWNIKGKSASDRFNYDYTEGELKELVPRLKELDRRVGLVQVVFNNNYEDQGQRNGRALMKLLHTA